MFGASIGGQPIALALEIGPGRPPGADIGAALASLVDDVGRIPRHLLGIGLAGEVLFGLVFRTRRRHRAKLRQSDGCVSETAWPARRGDDTEGGPNRALIVLAD